jgi:hypothetical protein
MDHITYHGTMTFGGGFHGAHTESVAVNATFRAVLAFFEEHVWPVLQEWLPGCDPRKDKLKAFRHWAGLPTFITVSCWNAAAWQQLAERELPHFLT